MAASCKKEAKKEAKKPAKESENDPVEPVEILSWRRKYPDAKKIRIKHGSVITDQVLLDLEGIPEVDMRGCVLTGVTGDAAFALLVGIHTLILEGCTFGPTLTAGLFKHFESIRVLNINGLTHPAITDEAFTYLEGLEVLSMQYCWLNRGITDAAFKNLSSLVSLDMYSCDQPTITSAALDPLKKLKFLDARGCGQFTLEKINAFKELGCQVFWD
jgi:hypothetical protein